MTEAKPMIECGVKMRGKRNPMAFAKAVYFGACAIERNKEFKENPSKWIEAAIRIARESLVGGILDEILMHDQHSLLYWLKQKGFVK